MEQLTYNPYLLYSPLNGLGIVGLQTNNTLFLADRIFADTKETKLQEAKFLAVLPTVNGFDWKFNQSKRQSNQSNTRSDISQANQIFEPRSDI
jgi:hypothetical protein